MEIKTLRLEDIIYIHTEIMKTTPMEDSGMAANMSLESAINRIDQRIYYEGVTNLFDIAALYGEAIAKGHCFANGNKRTALVSIIAFLFLNDMRLNVGQDRASDMIVLLAINLVTCEELSLWLRFHSSYRPTE